METLGQRIYRIDEVIWDIYHRLIYYPEDSSIYQEIKEILRTNCNNILKGYDIIFIVRVKCKEAPFCAIKNSVVHLLKKAKLLGINS